MHVFTRCTTADSYESHPNTCHLVSHDSRSPSQESSEFIGITVNFHLRMLVSCMASYLISMPVVDYFASAVLL